MGCGLRRSWDNLVVSLRVDDGGQMVLGGDVRSQRSDCEDTVRWRAVAHVLKYRFIL